MAVTSTQGFFLQRSAALFPSQGWPNSSLKCSPLLGSRNFCWGGMYARSLPESSAKLALRSEAVEQDTAGAELDEVRQKTRVLGLSALVKESDGKLIGRTAGSNEAESDNGDVSTRKRWFPHGDSFQVKAGTTVTRGAITEMLDPYMLEERKQRIESVIANRTFSVCMVVEGLSDVGNVSAICRTADALGFQSVHVISNSRKLRYRENPRTSAGAEKWLDVERWDCTATCLEALRSRGYRIAVTHIAADTVAIHDMDWTIPTAVVLGNEHRGISEEAIALSDIRCCIPMAGMVESFNVSVAAAIVMHHATMDRLSRTGFHGDLSEEERQILRAEFYMRHRDESKSILDHLVNKKSENKVC